MEKDQSFQLVFEGAQDDSSDTLRRLKSALIADLNFSVAEAQEFLNNVPLTIKRAQSEPELSVAFKTLQSAGAKVLILHPIGQVPSNDKTLGTPESNTIKPSGDVQPVPVTFEFDSGDRVEPTKEPPKIPAAALATPDNAPLFELDSDQTPNKGPSLFDEFKEQAKSSPATEKNSDTPSLSFADLTIADAPETEPLVDKNASHLTLEDHDSDLTLGGEDPTLGREEASAQSQNIFTDGLSLSIDAPEEDGPLAEKETKTPPQTIDDTEQEGDAEEAGPELSLAELQAKAREKRSGINNEISNASEQEVTRAEVGSIDSEDTPRSGSGKWPKMSRDLALPLSVGLTVLVSYNLYNYFSQEEPTLPNVRAADTISPVKTTVPSKKAKVAVVEAKPLEVIKLYGENQYADMTISWQLDTDGVSVKASTFSIATPRPPDRTADEVVHNIAPRPWLYKLEIDELAFDLKPDGSFIATGPARAYVQNEAQRNRVVAEVKMVGKMDLAKHQLTSELTVRRGLDSASNGKSLEVAVNGAETSLFLSTVVATDHDTDS